MRTQQEILNKIKEVENLILSPKEPAYVQYKILVYKLNWSNAIHYLEPAYRNDEQKAKWATTSRQDDFLIKKDIIEKLDLACMHFLDRDPIACMGIAVGLLTYVWLMGTKYDRILLILYTEFSARYAVENCFRGVFEGVANEFGVDWERLKLRYRNNRIKDHI